ncbi:MAG: hypothetical protein JST89_04210 [Cyanobacteria bacterium SZAS-4]|nr:hypothetical protein [Cyanobacteria bacterium SZAS-4]
MFIKREIPLRIILFFSWKAIIGFFVLSAAVYVAYTHLNIKTIAIPFEPIAAIGIAVAFYAGFKNNSSYERLWEARKLWGKITNESRSIAMQTLALFSGCADSSKEMEATKKELIYRQIAWVNMVRLQLRRNIVWEAEPLNKLPHIEIVRLHRQEEEYEQQVQLCLLQFTSKSEYEQVRSKNNIASELLSIQTRRIFELKAEKMLDIEEASEFHKHIDNCVDAQGGCERIKSFPFPRQYAYFSVVFIVIFCSLLPFGIIHNIEKMNPTMTWLTIPVSVLVSWVFYTMEKIGDSSEDPFENGLNDIPMSAICRNIEIDLRELRGETELPPRLEAHANILL